MKKTLTCTLTYIHMTDAPQTTSGCSPDHDLMVGFSTTTGLKKKEEKRTNANAVQQIHVHPTFNLDCFPTSMVMLVVLVGWHSIFSSPQQPAHLTRGTQEGLKMCSTSVGYSSTTSTNFSMVLQKLRLQTSWNINTVKDNRSGSWVNTRVLEFYTEVPGRLCTWAAHWATGSFKSWLWLWFYKSRVWKYTNTYKVLQFHTVLLNI